MTRALMKPWIATGRDALPLRLVRRGVLNMLRDRRDFLRMARARRVARPGFVLQAAARGDDDPRIRIGFTASRKVGNAVVRARAKRRLRAIARDVLPGMGRPGWDYVLIARRETTVGAPFARMRADLEGALERAHHGRRNGRGHDGRGDGGRNRDEEG